VRYISLYDIYGNKQSVSNCSVTYNYTYDLKNRPLSKTDSRTGMSLSYTYDNAGNIATRTNYDNTTMQYAYDGANRLVGEQNTSFLSVSYYYDGAGRLLDRILSNGAKTAYTWDDANRLLTLTNTSANGSVINSTTYVRDNLGNITIQTDASGTTLLPDAGYTYDSVGNRLTMTKNGTTLAYVYDVDNRLTQIHQGTATGPLLNSYVYDNDNNRIQKNNSSGTTIQNIVYDAKGRAVTITTSGVSTATTLTYDPYDYRIAKTDSKGSKMYLLEGEHLEALLDGNNNWTTMYMRGTVIDEIVNAYEIEGTNQWTNYTFHHDNLQSVLGLSGHDGTVLQTISYDPFGNTIGTTGSANNNQLHYTGREQDPDTGLYNYRARIYDPTTGTFCTEDPMHFSAGVNFYSYAGGNPINANDPYGLTWRSDLLGALSAGLNTAALATVWNPVAAGYLKFAGGVASLATVVNAGYEYHTGEISGPQFVITAGTEAASFIGGFAAKPVEAFVSGITRGVGIADTTVNTVQDFAAAYNQQTTSSGTSGLYIPGYSGPAATPSLFDKYSNTNPASNTSFDLSGFSDSGNNPAANGGFLIYPNMPNTNMMQSVYRK